MVPNPVIGVVPADPERIHLLKRHVLVFDKVAIPELELFSTMADEYIGVDLQWLHEQDLLIEPDLNSAIGLDIPEIQEELRRTREAQDRVSPIERQLERKQHRVGSSIPREALPVLKELLSDSIREHRLIATATARIAGAALRHSGADAVPVLDSLADVTVALPTQSVAVVQVVLDSLPIPNDATPWEQILEFKSDDRVRGFHTDLRNWIVRGAKSELSPRELAGEIEAAVARYERYMQAHRIQKETATVQTIIKAGAVGAVAGISVNEVAALVGVVGSIAVNLRQRRVELLQAELSAPGTELAYISKARKTFGN